MKPVIDYRVYLVTDTVYFNDSNVWNKLEAALAGGVTLVQYRDKTASSRTLYERALKMKVLCDKYRVPMLVDDRADIAFAVGAAGVHVGQDDLPPEQARRILGADAIIGVSAHNAEEARLAEAASADYLGCGAVYATSTKKDTSVIGTEGLKAIHAATVLPFVGIGGITLANYQSVLKAGADGAAIVSAILGAEDIKGTVQKFVQLSL
ncbi:MAG: thiamine phosphate synthase [Phascolarctobacterium sp.]|nr:MAG: thiamine phosphate synthase [Phascolarctobacterium sp.]